MGEHAATKGVRVDGVSLTVQKCNRRNVHALARAHTHNQRVSVSVHSRAPRKRQVVESRG